ncbi:phage terminase large subunit [Enterococcus faecalis]|nr:MULTISPECIES: phage terminase large subunit [Enterococcus]HAP4939843.1 phage terminase large subunit [Enterococcus faecalis ADL-123]EGO2664151.1 phage terminase large subunit [Enterococcus faecalis]EGO2735590.1 phage terminase large subunit [Enterococcus faecalis]EGO2823153.1 phage terminase large subunit [Enterococcus faecalis]EGO6638943.1 phage terminase large subunit [Enterococcus faecalis]
MDKIVLGAKLELSRRYFWDYCKLMASDFYKQDRVYLKELCNDLQEFIYDSEDNVLVINEPPRHGKSRTAGKFVEWLLGNDNQKKIMTGSYNETLSTTFSKSVRNTVQEIKADESRIVFSDVFPGVEIKSGDGAMNLWSLAGGYNNYLATSPTGTATGFGADIIIIDDLIKNAEEANNVMVLEKHWDWFINTMLSRLETGGKIIIIMTRWHSNDLAGKALKELPQSGYKVKHISMKAYNEETDTMLCESVLSKEEYFRKKKTMGADIASANYQQEPIDLKGCLYQKFLTYDTLPENIIKIWNYTDTADKGADYFASPVFAETADHRAYLLDVLYTKEPMEVTENAHANMIIRNKVNHVRIEGNNGGRGFRRNSERLVKERGYYTAYYEDFHQSANKYSRILSNSAWIENNVYYPSDWATRWPEFYFAMTTYQREGKNAHDDAPDAVTGIAETLQIQNPQNLKDRMNAAKFFFG